MTVVGDGSLVETQQAKSADGTLLSISVTSTSADRKTISISTDSDGDGHIDLLKTIVIDEDGATRSRSKTFNANGSLKSNRVDVTSADGLSLSSYVDLDGDETVSEASNYDLTTFDATGNRTRTVSVFDATGAPVSTSVTKTSADSLTQTVREYLDLDERNRGPHDSDGDRAWRGRQPNSYNQEVQHQRHAACQIGSQDQRRPQDDQDEDRRKRPLLDVATPRSTERGSMSSMPMAVTGFALDHAVSVGTAILTIVIRPQTNTDQLRNSSCGHHDRTTDHGSWRRVCCVNRVRDRHQLRAKAPTPPRAKCRRL